MVKISAPFLSFKSVFGSAKPVGDSLRKFSVLLHPANTSSRQKI
jgi:hypothetical protein